MKRSQKPDTPPLWTLPELCRLVEAALAASGYQAPANGQVRALPSERAIRYYSTAGLLDRPARMDGRTALYAQRHLLQLVAIKRLQAAGLPLHAVQQQLYGVDDARLAELADLREIPDLPAPAAAAEPGEAEESPPAADRRETAFWAAAPAPLALDEEARSAADDDPEGEPLHGVELDARTLLLLRGGPALSEAERHALRIAAAPLLRWLKARND